jgi:hypothetical protein
LPCTSRLTLGMHYASVHFSRVSVSFYTSVPSSLLALPQALHASHLFIAWPGRLERRKNPAFHPQYRTSFLSPFATRSTSSPTLMHMYPSSIRTMPKKESARASQPTKHANPPIHRTHIPNPNPIIFLFTIPFLFHSIATPSNLLHPTSTLLHVRQVLPARRVPRRHVLLHAVGVAGRFARRQGGAGGRDAAVEAVFVEFLRRNHTISFGKSGNFDWMSARGRMGEEGYGMWESGCGCGRMGMAYLDKSASVRDGGLLAHLLHDFGFGVHFGGDWGGA